jgi:hypothetical protein
LIQRLGHRRKAALAAFQAVATREPEQEGQQTNFNSTASWFYLNYLPTDFSELPADLLLNLKSILVRI